MAKRVGTRAKTKAQQASDDAARSVGAGRPIELETVDFSDPKRPNTCLEVDFPILPVNQIAAIEGKGSGALKPIYQVSKWWARRRSTVFRSLLLSASMKAPKDPAQAAKAVWDAYYANPEGSPGLFLAREFSECGVSFGVHEHTTSCDEGAAPW